MRWLDGVTNSMNMNLSELRELVVHREAWRTVIHGVAESRTWLRTDLELDGVCTHECSVTSTPVTPWAAATQALSMEFSRQEY